MEECWRIFDVSDLKSRHYLVNRLKNLEKNVFVWLIFYGLFADYLKYCFAIITVLVSYTVRN